MTITTAPEFIVRRRAWQKCCDTGHKAQSRGASRLAAKLYKLGASPWRATRQAVEAMLPKPGGRVA